MKAKFKSIIGTPGKRFVILIVSALIIVSVVYVTAAAAGAGGLSNNGISNTEETVQMSEASVQATGTGTSYIGEDAAKDAALTDAGLSASDVTFTKVALDTDDGIAVYDIGFYSDTYEYEYEINAASGAVVERQQKAFVIATGTTAADSAAYIGEDIAKAAALADAGLSASDVTFIKAVLDTDDGTVVYDVEFYSDSSEYEYEINAVSGAVAERQQEAFVTATGTTATDSAAYIGEDAAKAAALADTGLSASDVTFIKAVLDTDDGAVVYDVEFYSSSSEYEYEIDAVSGAVVEWDIESLNGDGS